jgi:hypothetical protein
MAVYTTIDNPELYFQCKLWTGDDSTDNAITFDGSENMQADMIWLKPRTKVDNHRVMDSVRGVTKMLPTNSNGAEETISAGLASFDSDGFTLNTTDSGYNSSSYTYVAWCWKESATAGFDIVTYTGNETARTISHSLSAVPKMMIVKNRGTTGNWGVYHVGLGTPNKRLELDGTAAADTGTSVWNDTDPTSSVFSVGDNDRITNGNSMTYVGYLFSEKQGYSKFTKVAGNSNDNGPYVHLGFSPAFLLFKEFTSGTNDSWYIIDNKRNTYNPRNKNLRPNNTDAEQEASWLNIDFLANGYKINDDDSAINESGREYVVMAFAEAPFVNSKGVPANAR